jgi:hypothetical protein
MIAPGRVFRNESVDASHEHTFYQVEGMMIDREVSDGAPGLLHEVLLKGIFGREVTVRLRPGYFPFVEPGFELDIKCLICGGRGCPVCKQSGWVETAALRPGASQCAAHQRHGSPKQWNGFAFGLGLTRLVMMRYGIDDIRLLQSGDLRFLGSSDLNEGLSDEILLQLDSRTGGGAGTGSRDAGPHHHEDRRVRRRRAPARMLEQVVRGRLLAVEPIAGGHNRKGRGGYGPLRPEDRGLRRAKLPPGHGLGLRAGGSRTPAGGSQVDSRRRKRRHAGQRRRAGHQPRRRAGSWNWICRAGRSSARAAGPDSIIEIDNKSITHRPDLWGHFGMAREVAAIRRKLRDPVRWSWCREGPAAIGVAIEDLELCPRYSALVLENVSVAALAAVAAIPAGGDRAEPHQQHRGRHQLVMAELAQPLHAFDQDLLARGDDFIRRARAGEWLTALNEEAYRLDPPEPGDRRRQRADRAGRRDRGLDSAIHARTRPDRAGERLLPRALDPPHFRRLKLRTDASMRFEKSQDPSQHGAGPGAGVELLRQVSPGIRIAGGVADCQREAARAGPDRAFARLAGAQAGPRGGGRRRCATFWNGLFRPAGGRGPGSLR